MKMSGKMWRFMRVYGNMSENMEICGGLRGENVLEVMEEKRNDGFVVE